MKPVGQKPLDARMHYLFISTGSWESNASMVRLRELGRGLIARGVKVTYAVDDLPYNRRSLQLAPEANVVFSSNLGPLSQLWKRRRTLRDINPDFVHVLNPAPKTAAALIGSKYQVVGDWDEWPVMRVNGALRQVRERFLDHWLRHRSARVIVASRYLQEQFRQRFHLEACYIPYAAYLPASPPTTTPYTQPTAVYMGNLFHCYDHDLIFQAAALLKSQGYSPAITLLGDGPQMEEWRRFIDQHRLSNVHLAGFVSGTELWRHLRHAHVLLLPIRPTLSNLSRCPSKTFAYAQARRPVIANRTGEVAEVLGDQATYIDCTPGAFAEAIRSAMANPVLPDVDYQVERQNWDQRAQALLSALS